MLPVLLLAAWARLAVFPQVLIGGVSPGNGDSEYHLRRILLAFDSFPGVSVFDPLLGWPQGHAHPWAPGFDWLGAALLHLTFLKDPAALAIGAACYPVLLGLFTVVLTMQLTARLLPEGAHRGMPLAAGALAALVPQFVGASRLGRIDHHVWETMSLMLLLCWALQALGPVGRAWRFEGLGLFAVVVALSGFVGGPLYLALVTPLLLVRPLLVPERAPGWGSGAAALGLGAAVSALINLGPVSEHGRVLSFGYPSLLQPLLALGASGVVVLVLLIGRVTASRLRRVLLLGAGLLALALLALFVPGLGPQVRGGLVDWLWKKDVWLSGISEFQPLFSLGRAPMQAVLFYFGFTGLFAVPLLMAALGLQRERSGALLAFTFVFGALLALTLLQMRFGRVLAPLLGVACVVGLNAVTRGWGPRGRRIILAGAVMLLVADPEVRNELLLADTRPPTPLEAAADQLVLHRPPIPGRREGVLASWESGNTLLSRAHRPVIASGFGSFVDAEGFALSASALATDEQALLEVMARRDLGFVVTGAGPMLKEQQGQRLLEQGPGGVRLNPVEFERRPIGVLLMGGSGLQGRVKHAEHLMPTQASEEQVGGLGWPLLWTYEFVKGATVTRTCRPGTPLVAHLEGFLGPRPFRWEAWASCPPDGRTTLRLCVATGFEGPGLVTAPAWLLEGSDGDEKLILDAAEIRAGASR